MNPDAVICTIDDPKKSVVVIDLVVEAGRGYQSIEESSKNRLHSDMIAVDAMFSPVTRVHFRLTRLALAKPISTSSELTIETDHSISPRDALKRPQQSLVNQYTALAGSTTRQSAPALGTTSEEELAS